MANHVITLADIRAHGPCEDGWRKLITALGTSERSTRLTIGDVAVANGLEDAMWCLRCIDDPRVRVAAVMPAVRRASAYVTDQRVHACIAAIERWLAGDDNVDLRAAAATAAEAALSAGWAATSAANAAEAAATAEAAGWAANAAAARAEARSEAAAERDRQVNELIATFGLLAMEGK